MIPKTLFDWLLHRYPTSKRETLRRMLGDGRLKVNGKKPRTLKLELAPTDRVEVLDRPSRDRVLAPVPAHRLPFRIVHEDEDVLVVDKPPGMLTSTGPREKRPTLLAAVQAYLLAREPRARVGLIHRLDRDASGLLVFSKNDTAYRALKTQFFHHTVERVYLAVTEGVPNPRAGRIASRLEERADGTVFVVTPGERKGELAITHYEVVESKAKKALVRVKLETGRKHQIRVHLAARKTPIVGDSVYGGAEKTARLNLAAVRLGLTHPRTGKPVSWEVTPPAEFWPAT